MANEVVKGNPFGGAVQLRNAAEMAKAVDASAQRGALGGAPEGSEYLNFSGKRGVYEFGREKENVDKRERWLVNIASFEDGFVCWKGGAPVATRLANIYTQPPVQEPDMDEGGPFDTGNGEGWHKAKTMVVKSVDEDDKQGYFKTNSKSGVAVFADLQNEVAQRLRQGRPAWPLIQMGVETFIAKGQKNSKPKFTIYGWLDDERVGALGADPDSDIDELIELSEKGGAIDADDDQDEAPRRGRRRL